MLSTSIVVGHVLRFFSFTSDRNFYLSKLWYKWRSCNSFSQLYIHIITVGLQMKKKNFHSKPVNVRLPKMHNYIDSPSLRYVHKFVCLYFFLTVFPKKKIFFSYYTLDFCFCSCSRIWLSKRIALWCLNKIVTNYSTVLHRCLFWSWIKYIFFDSFICSF